MRKIIEDLESLVKEVLGRDFSHGYPHVERVWRIAYDIVEHTGLEVDSCLLDISILLHDIGRVIGEPHAYYSALFARAYLEEQGVDRDFIDKVVNAILYHSYSYARKHDIKPLTEEAKILSDADKLDALGVVGFLRVFHYSWEYGRDLEQTLNHFHEKIFNLHKLMHYEYTRRKAIELTRITRELVERLINEIELAKGQT